MSNDLFRLFRAVAAVTRLSVVLLVVTSADARVAEAANGNQIRWLIVGASDPSAGRIARAAKGLVAKQPAALVFQTGDCGEKRNVFGVALEMFDSVAVAKAALGKQVAIARGAYIKVCPVVPGSLLALRFHAVDPSIADATGDAVELNDADRVSTITRLPGERVLVVQRMGRNIDANADAGPLDGITGRVVLVSGPAQRKVLVDDCTLPGKVTTFGERFAFQCVGSMAADSFLHRIFVFDSAGQQLAKAEPCRDPKFRDGSSLVCNEESVGEDGYKLRRKRVALPPPAEVGGER